LISLNWVEQINKVVEERRKDRAKEEKRLRLVFDAVRFFQQNMKDNSEELDSLIERIMNGECRNVEQWEHELQWSLGRFDEERYGNGDYN